jgi:hypothetical protein
LSRKDWVSLIKFVNPLVSGRYILFYQLMPSRESIDFVERLKSYYGYEVVEIRGRVEPLLFGSRYLQTGSPLDFISLIRNAEIVVSTSFHGVAFSVIFEKQFYALGMKNNSGRVLSLLNSLKIYNRIVHDIDLVDFSHKIDYENVFVKLEALVNESRDYLSKSLTFN